MDDREKLSEITLVEKEEFYSNLNMKDIADADYMHAKRVYKNSEINNLSEYYDLYHKNDPLLLFNVFENLQNLFKNLSFKIPIKFLSVPQLAWQAA